MHKTITLLVLRNRVSWINYWLRPISCSSDLNLPNGEISYLPRSNFVPNFMVFYIDCAIIIVLLYITYPLLCMYRVSISFQPFLYYRFQGWPRGWPDKFYRGCEWACQSQFRLLLSTVQFIFDLLYAHFRVNDLKLTFFDPKWAYHQSSFLSRTYCIFSFSVQ